MSSDSIDPSRVKLGNRAAHYALSPDDIWWEGMMHFQRHTYVSFSRPFLFNCGHHCCGAVAFKLLIAHGRILLNRAIATALIA